MSNSLSVQVKPFGNCDPVNRCNNQVTSFSSTPKQPTTPLSMQGLSGSNSGIHPSSISGLFRPM